MVVQQLLAQARNKRGSKHRGRARTNARAKEALDEESRHRKTGESTVTKSCSSCSPVPTLAHGSISSEERNPIPLDLNLVSYPRASPSPSPASAPSSSLPLVSVSKLQSISAPSHQTTSYSDDCNVPLSAVANSETSRSTYTSSPSSRNSGSLHQAVHLLTEQLTHSLRIADDPKHAHVQAGYPESVKQKQRNSKLSAGDDTTLSPISVT